MHMADALLSPAVGTTMWGLAAGAIALSSRKVSRILDDRKVPLMGVMGAFIFAVQMINFSIPGTGSSGHLGGGLMLAILLGPHAAFLTMASVLIVQALFFADGGLLALGCNIFNLGIFPCFIAYPFIYLRLAGRGVVSRGRIITASIIAAIIGLQFGAFAVVLQTVLSGVAELTLPGFALLMQPVHLAIGLIEGVATATVVLFLMSARPDILDGMSVAAKQQSKSLRGVLMALVAVTVMIGGLLAWFASTDPDGLEWALQKVTGHEELVLPESELHQSLQSLQEKTALLPDYEQPGHEGSRSGKSLSGLVGSGLVLLLTGGVAWLLRRPRSKAGKIG